MEERGRRDARDARDVNVTLSWRGRKRLDVVDLLKLTGIITKLLWNWPVVDRRIALELSWIQLFNELWMFFEVDTELGPGCTELALKLMQICSHIALKLP